MDDEEWLYYRVYVTGLSEIRDLVEQVLVPWAARSTGMRWFFLQYVDVLGWHLRLRIQATPERLAEYERELDQAFAGRRVVKRLYEPEYTKFGGTDGVAFAEQVLQLGSEAALACAGPRHRAARTAYGAAHTSLIAACLPDDLRLSFLHQYAWYWSGGGPRTPVWETTKAKLHPGNPQAMSRARSLRTQIGEVLADSATHDTLTGYAADFWRLAASRAPKERTDYLLAFHHVHLMNNRLGVVPGEEAQIARLLWLEELTGGSTMHACSRAEFCSERSH